jgi:hypothetical protein
VWPAVIEQIRERNAMLAAALAEARPVGVDGGELTLAFAPRAAFLKRKAEQDEHRRTTAEAVQAMTGQRLTIRYELADSDEEAQPPVPLLRDEELLKRLMEEFDAEEILEEETT